MCNAGIPCILRIVNSGAGFPRLQQIFAANDVVNEVQHSLDALFLVAGQVERARPGNCILLLLSLFLPVSTCPYQSLYYCKAKEAQLWWHIVAFFLTKSLVSLHEVPLASNKIKMARTLSLPGRKERRKEG